MSTEIDWGRLVRQNRAKAMGIPWSTEELEAIQRGISPDDVRAGILTKQKVKEAGPVPTEGKILPAALKRMKLQELIEYAKSLGLTFEESAVTRADLILEIEQVQSK